MATKNTKNTKKKVSFTKPPPPSLPQIGGGAESTIVDKMVADAVNSRPQSADHHRLDHYKEKKIFVISVIFVANCPRHCQIRSYP